MALTEFYVRADGSNTNSGSTDAAAASVTSTNGDWNNAAANRFTAASGTPFSGVMVGDFAAVMDDADTQTDLVGRITAVNGGGASIDIDTTARVGTSGTAATGKTCKVGGSWGGGSANNVAFGFTFPTAALVNTSGNFPRINFRSGTIYSVTAVIAPAADNMRYEGYTTTAGDGGRPHIQGPASGASFELLKHPVAGSTGITSLFKNFEFSRNGSTGSAIGIFANTDGIYFDGLYIHDIRGIGFYSGARSNIVVTKSKAVACNLSATATWGGFIGGDGINGVTTFMHCRATGNTGHGFNLGGTDASGRLFNCIADANTGNGALVHGNRDVVTVLTGCDFYNNTLAGIATSATATQLLLIQNCNLVKNGTQGIKIDTGANCRGDIRNCGFGGGAFANVSGNIDDPDGAMVVSGTVNYTTHPWADPDTGDFDITNSAAKNTGYGAFIDTSYVAFPDIGAAQHQDAGGGGGGSTAPMVIGCGDLGDFVEDELNVVLNFWTQDKNGTPITIAGSPVVKVFKEGDATGRASGTDPEITFTLNKIDPAGSAVTGTHHVKIDTSTQTYYEKNKGYRVILTAGTVDGISKAGHPVASFGIENSGIIQRAATKAQVSDQVWNDAGIKTRTNNPTLNAVLGVPDTITNKLYVDGYWAKLIFIRGTTQDKYEVTWLQHASQQPTSDVSSPTITVVDDDGVNLITSAAMTQVGTTQVYKYLTTTARLPLGKTAVATVNATVDGAARSWPIPIGRDA